MSETTNYDGDVEVIRTLEAARYRAMIESNVQALDDFLAADVVYIHSTGMLDTKAKLLESIRSGHIRYQAFTHEAIEYRRLADGCILVFGRIIMTLVIGGRDRRLDNLFTCVWVRFGNKWQLASWQSTAVPSILA